MEGKNFQGKRKKRELTNSFSLESKILTELLVSLLGDNPIQVYLAAL
jgi:hypothetical protein